MFSKIKRGICLLLCMVMLGSTCAACGGGASDENSVRFYVFGSVEQVEMYTVLVDAFNDTYGKEHGIQVNLSAYDSNGYLSKIQPLVTAYIPVNGKGSSGASSLVVITMREPLFKSETKALFIR